MGAPTFVFLLLSALAAFLFLLESASARQLHGDNALIGARDRWIQRHYANDNTPGSPSDAHVPNHLVDLDFDIPPLFSARASSRQDSSSETPSIPIPTISTSHTAPNSDITPAPLIRRYQHDLDKYHQLLKRAPVCPIITQTTIWISITIGGGQVPFSTTWGPRPTGLPGDETTFTLSVTDDGGGGGGDDNDNPDDGGDSPSLAENEALLAAIFVIVAILLAAAAAFAWYLFKRRRARKLAAENPGPKDAQAAVKEMGSKGFATLNASTPTTPASASRRNGIFERAMAVWDRARNNRSSVRSDDSELQTWARTVSAEPTPGKRRSIRWSEAYTAYTGPRSSKERSSEKGKFPRVPTLSSRTSDEIAVPPGPQDVMNNIQPQPSTWYSESLTSGSSAGYPAKSNAKALPPVHDDVYPDVIPRPRSRSPSPASLLRRQSSSGAKSILPKFPMPPALTYPLPASSDGGGSRSASPRRKSQDEPLSPSAWMAGFGVPRGRPPPPAATASSSSSPSQSSHQNPFVDPEAASSHERPLSEETDDGIQFPRTTPRILPETSAVGPSTPLKSSPEAASSTMKTPTQDTISRIKDGKKIVSMALGSLPATRSEEEFDFGSTSTHHRQLDDDEFDEDGYTTQALGAPWRNSQISYPYANLINSSRERPISGTSGSRSITTTALLEDLDTSTTDHSFEVNRGRRRSLVSTGATGRGVRWTRDSDMFTPVESMISDRAKFGSGLSSTNEGSGPDAALLQLTGRYREPIVAGFDTSRPPAVPLPSAPEASGSRGRGESRNPGPSYYGRQADLSRAGPVASNSPENDVQELDNPFSSDHAIDFMKHPPSAPLPLAQRPSLSTIFSAYDSPQVDRHLQAHHARNPTSVSAISRSNTELSSLPGEEPAKLDTTTWDNPGGRERDEEGLFYRTKNIMPGPPQEVISPSSIENSSRRQESPQ